MSLWDANHRANHAAGCLSGANRTHGLSRTSTYKIWKGIKDRCYNQKTPIWRYYGGRGITVCDTWLSGFAAFLADMGVRPEGKELDRINNDGPYSPDNCRWVSHAENMRNCRRNVYIEYGGKRRRLTDWARLIGRSHSTLSKRLAAGWIPREILFGRRAAARMVS